MERIHRFVTFLLLAAVGLIGCEENLAPREPYDALPFSVYGVLSPDLDTQSVRLYLPEDFPTLGSPEPLDVDVISTDLHTGEWRTWHDSVLVEPNGQHEYVFWEPFQAEFGHVYRVEVVRRSDGVMSYADVRIPPPVTVRIDDQGDPLLEVFIEGEDFRALKPEAEYAVRGAGSGEDDPSPSFPILSYTFPYEGHERRVAQGWRVTFNMIADFDALRFLYVADGGSIPAWYCFDLELLGLEVHMLVGDAVWDPPGGVFEAHLLAQPQTLSNVENGFGFIGGGYRITKPLFPSQEAVESACFVYVW